MPTQSSSQRFLPTQLLQALVARVGKHGCDAAWQSLGKQDTVRYSFLLNAPSAGNGTAHKNCRLVRLQTLDPEGLDLEWMAADDGVLDVRGNAVSGAGRWVLRTITIHLAPPARRAYSGDLPFGLGRSSDFAQVQMLLGGDHTPAPNFKDTRVTFFLADGRSVEILYGKNLSTIAQISVSFLGTSVPCA